jgi:hypothetical protein
MAWQQIYKICKLAYVDIAERGMPSDTYELEILLTVAIMTLLERANFNMYIIANIITAQL